MGETRQPYLNGAYYGPPIPPTKTYHRHGRGGGGCCCNPFTCCCSCIANLICTCIFQILCTILVLAGILIFVLWLIFRPNVIKFYATDASLTKFNLNNNNSLQYNLAMNLTIRNPNRRIGVYYDQIQAVALYQGQNFSSVQLTPFYQGHKTTDSFAVDFNGQASLLLGSDGLSNYASDTNSAAYNIDVKLYIRGRLKFWFVKSMTVRPKIECKLDNIPLSSNTTAAAPATLFDTRRCNFDWR